MIIKNRVRRDISKVYNTAIPAGKWQEYLELLDRSGHPNRKELLDILLIYGLHIEVLEDLVEELYTKLKPSKDV